MQFTESLKHRSWQVALHRGVIEDPLYDMIERLDQPLVTPLLVALPDRIICAPTPPCLRVGRLLS